MFLVYTKKKKFKNERLSFIHILLSIYLFFDVGLLNTSFSCLRLTTTKLKVSEI